ncbi:hypothetical protein CDL12_14179 [Handroanthus impetiginosus]|uniref:DYW domain-containing protein n=1 Tax=Handroanthus impetiginosus TaxID=429701 RepID=A0A2G9H6R9_9LAMI|nr:hypothetical protein CDL12_14179 [Handroanthus impetiginosus]
MIRNGLIDMYVKCGSLETARELFDCMGNPDVVSWSSLIVGLAMETAPDDITVRSLLCGFTDPFTLSQGKQVHSYIIKTGVNLHLPVCNTLLTMYANCSEYKDAYKMFKNIQANADLVSWNAIITMCLHHHQVAEVFSLFRTMLLFDLEMGHQIYCCAVKNGLDFDIMIRNGLIDMYVKCGSLETARELFDCMGNPDVVSWSSLIVGYAQFGYGEEALNLFSRMKNQGIKPNQVTFVGALTACSHVGLVEEGMKLFEIMEREHDVVRTREHFSCVIDMLARAGRIQDAEVIINQMVIEPDIVMWKTLLAACKNHGNIEVGKRVAKNILKIDPSNSAAHVLLCGIYASAADWKDVATLRSLMREKGVNKIPGQSWIEVKDRIHVFSAEDGLHPEREKIFLMLEELWLQSVDAGYSSSLVIEYAGEST